MPQTAIGHGPRLDAAAEDYLARLTDAAYRVALKHGIGGCFIDVQLDLWAALRGVVAGRAEGRQRPRRAVAAG